VINSFTKHYAFLSNFYPSPIELDGLVYPTVEHAYAAAKTLNPRQREMIRLVLKPGVAKQFGKHVDLRPNWDASRLSIMYSLLQKKFSIPELRSQLLATEDEELIEGNFWGDDFWGVPYGPLYSGIGQNHLGKLLMKIRSEIRQSLVA
jgi:ribA/ribD-fused uncharacterized protein